MKKPSPNVLAVITSCVFDVLELDDPTLSTTVDDMVVWEYYGDTSVSDLFDIACKVSTEAGEARTKLSRTDIQALKQFVAQLKSTILQE